MNLYQRDDSQQMSNHLRNGIILKQINLKDIVPEGVDFEELDINEQRFLIANALQDQVVAIQGEKVALVCMSRVSTYDTYEEALAVRNSCPYLDSSIYLPKDYKMPI